VGWRLIEHGPADEWRAYGERIGWVNGEEILLDPTAAYRVCQDMLSGQLGISSRGLRRLLASDGLIVSDAARSTTMVRRHLCGAQRNVLLLAWNFFSDSEEFSFSAEGSDEVPI
jgi:hypothetical protein